MVLIVMRVQSPLAATVRRLRLPRLPIACAKTHSLQRLYFRRRVQCPSDPKARKAPDDVHVGPGSLGFPRLPLTKLPGVWRRFGVVKSGAEKSEAIRSERELSGFAFPCGQLQVATKDEQRPKAMTRKW